MAECLQVVPENIGQSDVQNVPRETNTNTVSMVYLLSLLCVGNFGKNAASMAAMAGGEVDNVYLPPPNNNKPKAIWVVR